MLCSFVIPAHDEEEWIAGSISAVQSAASQLDLAYEIIVVADSCNDATAQLAGDMGARVIEVGFRQISATRNEGARNANGDVLIFVDADTEVTTNALRLALKALQDGAVGGGSTVSFDGPIPLFMRLAIGVIGFLLASARYTGGCSFFCKHDVFERAGGFDEQLYIAEEIFLARELKKFGRFVIVPGRILTSARKIRNHSVGEMLAIIWRTFIGGKAACQKREGLDLWYGERRGDPGRSMGERGTPGKLQE